MVTLALLLALGATETGSAEAKPPPAETSERAFSPLALGAAIVPGFLLHGAGHWVLGERDTAKRLFAMEGVGVGALCLGAGVLALSGASRYTTAPSIVVGASGGWLFLSSWVADMYGLVAPDDGWGAPPPPAPLALRLGTTLVRQPVFDFGPLLSAGGRSELGPWTLDLRLDAATGGLDKERVGVGRWLWRADDGARFGLNAAGSHLDHVPGHFTAWTVEAGVEGRAPLSRLDAALGGAFIDAQLGSALRRVEYGKTRHGAETVLLLRLALGAWLGTGEASIYYDHRHDDWAAGLVLPGVGSGPAGHFGVDARLPLAAGLSLVMDAQVGAAQVFTLGAEYRFTEEGPG